MRKQIRQADIFELIATGEMAKVSGIEEIHCKSIDMPFIVIYSNGCRKHYIISDKERRKQAIKIINKYIKEQL